MLTNICCWPSSLVYSSGKDFHIRLVRSSVGDVLSNPKANVNPTMGFHRSSFQIRAYRQPDDPHIQALAMFAVRQHNKESGETLSLTRGSDYRLVIGADGNSGAEDLYLAVVYENAWMHYRDLTAFNIIA
ncbi:unnamed protein product [Spirodela intermedia]|uniref:Cystatin domain-containing protein n=1 Tax=Spirodela intermedia TaxID=51605 RepID=A0A7I8J0R3_SPIIN|nr:unnamed protein product [Spirodela intermedia]CAA6662900.1 unnamed protein product [Spirodela intermedia]